MTDGGLEACLLRSRPAPSPDRRTGGTFGRVQDVYAGRTRLGHQPAGSAGKRAAPQSVSHGREMVARSSCPGSLLVQWLDQPPGRTARQMAGTLWRSC
jgi:hypothetical protein